MLTLTSFQITGITVQTKIVARAYYLFKNIAIKLYFDYEVCGNQKKMLKNQVTIICIYLYRK